MSGHFGKNVKVALNVLGQAQTWRHNAAKREETVAEKMQQVVHEPHSNKVTGLITASCGVCIFFKF